MRQLFTAALAASVMAAAGARAGTATSTFAVTATVLSKCSTSATALAFGNYTPGLGNVTASSSVSVKCTKNSPYTVALNVGTGTGAAFAAGRLMSSGTNTLQYNLYTTAALATVFGDGSGATATMAGTGAGLAAATAANTLTVYGQLPDNAANQLAAPGSYTDTITVTVSY